MKTLDRYLFKGILAKTGIMLFLLVAIFFLSEALRASQDLAGEPYGMGGMLLVLALRVPTMAFEVIPFAVLLGTLVLLGELGRHAELTAMRAGGVSLPRIVAPLLVGGAVVAVATFAINDRIAGPMERVSQDLFQASSAPGGWLPGGGLWFRDGHWMVAAERVGTGGKRLSGVRLYRRGEDGLLEAVLRAERLVHREGQWRARGAQRVTVADLRVGALESSALPLSLSPDLLTDLDQSPEQMTFARLADYVAELRQQGHPSGKLAFALWQKLTFPASCLVMVLVAAPFAGQTPRRSGRAGQLLAGIGVGLAFHASNLLVGHLSVAGGLPPPAAAWLPPAMFALLGGGLLLRQR